MTARARLLSGVRPSVRRSDRLVASRARCRRNVGVAGVGPVTRCASFLTPMAHFDLAVAAAARTLGPFGCMRRVAARASCVGIDRHCNQSRLLTVTARAGPGRKFVRLVAGRTTVVHRKGRCRNLLVTTRARLRGCDGGFVGSMAIEAALTSCVRGMVIRPLLVAAFAVSRRNGGFFVRLVAIFAVGRRVLHDGLSLTLLTAMTIDAGRCRRRREGVADEAIGLCRAATVGVGKLLLVASGANAGTRIGKSCPGDVVAFTTCNGSFPDVSFVSGTAPKLGPRRRHRFGGQGDRAP